MQEHIEYLKEERQLILRLGGLNERELIDEIIQKAERMLEKEKEAISTAFHTDRPSLSLYENGSAFEEWYNETFNTKEK